MFKLTPPVPPATQWTETVLYRFMGGRDGAFPFAGLIFDSHGALYGTTSGGGTANHGTVFKLQRGANEAAFPDASTIADNHGVLPGAIHNGRLIEKRSPDFQECPVFSFGACAEQVRF